MSEQPNLESALERLEEIAQHLEGGDIELSDALALYEEGVRLLRVAEGALNSAEARIQQLRPDGEGHRLDEMPEV